MLINLVKNGVTKQVDISEEEYAAMQKNSKYLVIDSSPIEQAQQPNIPYSDGEEMGVMDVIKHKMANPWEVLPVIKEAVQGYDAKKIGKIRDLQARGVPLTDRQKSDLQHYADEQGQEYTFAGGIANMIAEAVPYAAEFAIGNKIAAGAKLAGLAKNAAVLGMVSTPGGVAETIEGVEIKDKDIGTAAKDAVLNQAANNIFEMTGSSFVINNPLVKKLIGKQIEKVASTKTAKFLSGLGDNPLAKSIYYNNPIGEMGEEQLTNIANGLFYSTEMTSDPDFEYKMTTAKELSQQAIGFTLFGMGIKKVESMYFGEKREGDAPLKDIMDRLKTNTPYIDDDKLNKLYDAEQKGIFDTAKYAKYHDSFEQLSKDIGVLDNLKILHEQGLMTADEYNQYLSNRKSIEETKKALLEEYEAFDIEQKLKLNEIDKPSDYKANEDLLKRVAVPVQSGVDLQEPSWQTTKVDTYRPQGDETKQNGEIVNGKEISVEDMNFNFSQDILATEKEELDYYGQGKVGNAYIMPAGDNNNRMRMFVINDVKDKKGNRVGEKRQLITLNNISRDTIIHLPSLEDYGYEYSEGKSGDRGRNDLSNSLGNTKTSTGRLLFKEVIRTKPKNIQYNSELSSMTLNVFNDLLKAGYVPDPQKRGLFVYTKDPTFLGKFREQLDKFREPEDYSLIKAYSAKVNELQEKYGIILTPEQHDGLINELIELKKEIGTGYVTKEQYINLYSSRNDLEELLRSTELSNVDKVNILNNISEIDNVLAISNLNTINIQSKIETESNSDDGFSKKLQVPTG